MATEIKEMESMIFDDLALEIKYFVNTDSGKVRYSSEVVFNSNDKVIIDDKTLSRLKNKMDLLLPALIYSRVVAEQYQRIGQRL